MHGQQKEQRLRFFCKDCLKEVVLKKGRVRAHHFAHKSPVTCQYGIGKRMLIIRRKKEFLRL